MEKPDLTNLFGQATNYYTGWAIKNVALYFYPYLRQLIIGF